MFLREFIYFDNKSGEMIDDRRYSAENDISVLNMNHLRKTRLTLKMLNEIRRASDAREEEKLRERGLIRKMYAMPPPEQQA